MKRYQRQEEGEEVPSVICTSEHFGQLLSYLSLGLHGRTQGFLKPV